MHMQQPNACLHKKNYLSYWIWIKPSFMLLTIFAWKNLLPKNRKSIPQGNQNLRTILCMDCIVFNSTGHRNQTTSSLWKKGTTLNTLLPLSAVSITKAAPPRVPRRSSEDVWAAYLHDGNTKVCRRGRSHYRPQSRSLSWEHRLPRWYH